MSFPRVIELLKAMPNPNAAWLAIQSELLLANEVMRNLGAVQMIGGAILQTIPDPLRSELIPQVSELANLAWDMFESTYQGNADLFNSDRKRLYESIQGLLSIPKFAALPDAM